MGPQLYIHMDVVGLDFEKLADNMVEAIEEGMDALAKALEQEWHEKAAQTLKTSKDAYLAGVTVDRVGTDLVQATVSGFLPVSIEEGQEAYDMKPGLLGGNLRKIIPIGKGAGQKPKFTTLRAESQGWRHPGFQARRIHQQVWASVDDIKHKVFDPIVSRVSV